MAAAAAGTLVATTIPPGRERQPVPPSGQQGAVLLPLPHYPVTRTGTAWEVSLGGFGSPSPRGTPSGPAT
jgi:hypothetical protein